MRICGAFWSGSSPAAPRSSASTTGWRASQGSSETAIGSARFPISLPKGRAPSPRL